MFRKSLISALSVGVLATACKATPPGPENVSGPQPSTASSGPATSNAAQGPWASGPVKVGAPFELKDQVSLADVLAKPADYAGKTVLVTGQVERACSKKGCWMELRADGNPQGVRVTFKDYGFFVPLDSAGASARVEGNVEVKVLDQATADHLAAEGAKINRNADGTASEIGIVARAVELTKSS